MSRLLWLSAIAILIFNLIFLSYVISRILWLSAVAMFYFIYLSQLCDVEDYLGIFCSCKFWERKEKCMKLEDRMEVLSIRLCIEFCLFLKNKFLN
jgi:hypothetical protein